MKLTVDDMCLGEGTIIKNTYKIKKVIHRSELSIVYIGHHIKSKEIQVIKEYFPKALALRDLDNKSMLCRLPSFKGKYYELMEIFFNEAVIIRELHHKNIVGYIDHFEENGTGYIVLKYDKGRTLDTYIREEKEISMSDLFKNIILPMLRTLQFIHKQEIIHRDIKPGNILIREDGSPLLLDFGSAIYYKNQSSNRIFTSAGFSPLEFYSEKAKQGRYSDIYSFAATLYYCFSGRAPLDVSERLIEDRIENIKQHNKKITSLLARMIMWGLSINSRERCPSLKLFKAVLYVEHLRLKIIEIWIEKREKKKRMVNPTFIEKDMQ
ncbi:serine/threonine protein kinase [Aneurinibacillus aneurinilyticus]|uniref:Serine/threonine protein kinase n=2 Tax=Aneurinibacillus aneurinilyticus TaxID=1391 RepID=A0A848D072_ANEAE|nr:serine/threonine protein kinase [Aneurinibacillus aneurinilyticus]